MESPAIAGQPAPWRVARDGSDRDKCPVRDVISRLGDAWSMLVILILSNQGPHRFNALKREIGDISQRMLAVTLRQLERDGLVSRTVYPTKPPKVEYALTDLGRSLTEPIDALTGWAEDNHDRIRQARRHFDDAPSA